MHNMTIDRTGPEAAQCFINWWAAIHSPLRDANMTKFILALVFVVCTSPVFACESPDAEWSMILQSKKHTVKGPYTIAELESNNLIEIRETKEVLPFGYINKYWVQLKARYLPGDRFYFVHFQDGRFFVERHVLVRNDCVIGALMGAIS